jgi:hypothetical protein
MDINTLILPVCGQSTRFPGVRPKWLLTAPGGRSMLRESISGLYLKNIQRIVITATRQVIEENRVHLNKLLEQFYDIGAVIDCLLLDAQTKSQVETIERTLSELDIAGSFFVKDCDNYFECTPEISAAACVAYADLEEDTNATNKSYILIYKNEVTAISEKQVFSSSFCCGLYGFASGKKFVEHSANCQYVSEVIGKYLDELDLIRVIPAKGYVDWGTLSDWERYYREYEVIFCDIDGVLFENAGEYCGTPWGENQPIQENINKINRKYEKCEIILTTARPLSYKDITEKQLIDAGVMYDRILFDVMSRRTIVNDFSRTNPYPSCRAVNLPRNANNLQDYLK